MRRLGRRPGGDADVQLVCTTWLALARTALLLAAEFASLPCSGQEVEVPGPRRQPRPVRGAASRQGLCVCLHNAGGSQIIEVLFRHAAEGEHQARSAGATPAERVHPEVVEAMG